MKMEAHCVEKLRDEALPQVNTPCQQYRCYQPICTKSKWTMLHQITCWVDVDVYKESDN